MGPLEGTYLAVFRVLDARPESQAIESGAP